MDDCGIVQKAEIDLVRPPLRGIVRKRELEITLLSDCFASSRTPK